MIKVSGYKHATITPRRSLLAVISQKSKECIDQFRAVQILRELRLTFQSYSDNIIARTRATDELREIEELLERLEMDRKQQRFQNIINEKAKIGQCITALEDKMWSLPPGTDIKSKEAQQTMGDLARKLRVLEEKIETNLVQKWQAEELKAIIEQFSKYQVNVEVAAGTQTSQIIEQCAKLNGEVDQLISTAESLEFTNQQRMELIQRFKTALESIRFYVEEYGNYEEAGNIKSAIRFTAKRADGANIHLSFPLKGEVKTFAAGFQERVCFADYQSLVEQLNSLDVEANFITERGPLSSLEESKTVVEHSSTDFESSAGANV